MEEIEDVLIRIAGHITMVGYRYIEYIVRLILEAGEFPHRVLTKITYQEAAHHLGVSQSNLSKSIYRAVTDCWETGDRDALEKIAGKRLNEKPSSEALFYYLVRYMERQAEHQETVNV